MTRQPTDPPTPTDRIEGGDILFFAPPVEDGDFEDFNTLAVFSQGAPWTHVAIAGPRKGDGPPPVIGFGQTGDPTSIGNNWTPEIGRFDWASATDGYTVTALRHPTPGEGARIGAAAVKSIGKEYDTAGLLAFAAATQARLFQHGAARLRLHRFAKGVVAAGRRDDGSVRHTCVTAVGEALREVGVGLTIDDPALPPHDPATLPAQLISSIEDLYRRAGTAVEILGAPFEPMPILDTRQVAAGWGSLPAPLFPGDLIKTTTEYLDRLGGVMVQLKANPLLSPDHLVGLGESEPEPDALHPTVSPAMLRHALIQAEFIEVS